MVYLPLITSFCADWIALRTPSVTKKTALKEYGLGDSEFERASLRNFFCCQRGVLIKTPPKPG
jgi:hypothetical protein